MDGKNCPAQVDGAAATTRPTRVTNRMQCINFTTLSPFAEALKEPGPLPADPPRVTCYRCQPVRQAAMFVTEKSALISNHSGQSRSCAVQTSMAPCLNR